MSATDTWYPVMATYLRCRGSSEIRSSFSSVTFYFNVIMTLFGRVARLDPSVPANVIVHLMVSSHEGRPPGRLCHTGLNQIQHADARPLSIILRSEIVKGRGAVQRSSRTSPWWRWYNAWRRPDWVRLDRSAGYSWEVSNVVMDSKARRTFWNKTEIKFCFVPADHRQRWFISVLFQIVRRVSGSDIARRF